MARGIEEGDLVIFITDLVCTDALGDAAGFVERDIRLTKGIEQGGLAMVDVAHDGDDSRSWLQEARIILCRDILGRIRRSFCFDQGDAEFFCQDLDGVAVQVLVDGRHDAVHHECFDDLADFTSEKLSQLLDGNARRQLDFCRVRSHFLFIRVFLLLALAQRTGHEGTAFLLSAASFPVLLRLFLSRFFRSSGDRLLRGLFYRSLGSSCRALRTSRTIGLRAVTVSVILETVISSITAALSISCSLRAVAVAAETIISLTVSSLRAASSVTTFPVSVISAFASSITALAFSSSVTAPILTGCLSRRTGRAFCRLGRLCLRRFLLRSFCLRSRFRSRFRSFCRRCFFRGVGGVGRLAGIALLAIRLACLIKTDGTHHRALCRFLLFRSNVTREDGLAIVIHAGETVRHIDMTGFQNFNDLFICLAKFLGKFINSVLLFLHKQPPKCMSI